MADDIFVATQSGVVNLDGNQYRIRKDVTRVRAGHKLLSTGLFKPIDVHYDVETTRQAPAQKRGGRRQQKAEDDDE